jgi:hypothetical protein
VEDVASFGKPAQKEGKPTEEKQPIPNGTGTETGNERVKKENEVA